MLPIAVLSLTTRSQLLLNLGQNTSQLMVDFLTEQDTDGVQNTKTKKTGFRLTLAKKFKCVLLQPKGQFLITKIKPGLQISTCLTHRTETHGQFIRMEMARKW